MSDEKRLQTKLEETGVSLEMFRTRGDTKATVRAMWKRQSGVHVNRSVQIGLLHGSIVEASLEAIDQLEDELNDQGKDIHEKH